MLAEVKIEVLLQSRLQVNWMVVARDLLAGIKKNGGLVVQVKGERVGGFRQMLQGRSKTTGLRKEGWRANKCILQNEQQDIFYTVLTLTMCKCQEQRIVFGPSFQRRRGIPGRSNS